MAAIIEKLDLKKELKPFFSASAKPAIVDVPAMNYLMVDGAGDPNTASFAVAVEALYSLAYALKFTVKRSAQPVDYPVMALEGLWWADDMAAFVKANRAAWKWTLMIVQPALITAALVADALAELRKKKPSPALDLIRFARFAEGRAAQIMHVGPYSAEGPNIEKLHAFIAAQGGTLSGRHHEIYLSDMRRTAPDRLKTIIRQPFAL